MECFIEKKGYKYRVTDQKIIEELFEIKLRIDYYKGKSRVFLCLAAIGTIVMSLYTIMVLLSVPFSLLYKETAVSIFLLFIASAACASIYHRRKEEKYKKIFLDKRDSISQSKLMKVEES